VEGVVIVNGPAINAMTGQHIEDFSEKVQTQKLNVRLFAVRESLAAVSTMLVQFATASCRMTDGSAAIRRVVERKTCTEPTNPAGGVALLAIGLLIPINKIANVVKITSKSQKMAQERESHPNKLPAYFTQPALQPRPLRVIGIGAGASGLLLAYKIQRNFDLIDLKIFEKNKGMSAPIPNFYRLTESVKDLEELGGRYVKIKLLV
jgi:hypothetical protein